MASPPPGFFCWFPSGFFWLWGITGAQFCRWFWVASAPFVGFFCFTGPVLCSWLCGLTNPKCCCPKVLPIDVLFFCGTSIDVFIFTWCGWVPPHLILGCVLFTTHTFGFRFLSHRPSAVVEPPPPAVSLPRRPRRLRQPLLPPTTFSQPQKPTLIPPGFGLHPPKFFPPSWEVIFVPPKPPPDGPIPCSRLCFSLYFLYFLFPGVLFPPVCPPDPSQRECKGVVLVLPPFVFGTPTRWFFRSPRQTKTLPGRVFSLPPPNLGVPPESRVHHGAGLCRRRVIILDLIPLFTVHES